MKIKTGFGRVVFVFDKLVIKIPKPTRISTFAFGMMENITERYWYCADSTIYRGETNNYPLAKILWSSHTGLITIMERAEVVTEQVFHEQMTKEGQDKYIKDFDELQKWAKGLPLYHDLRFDNVGYVGDRLVAIDYGYVTRSLFFADKAKTIVTIHKDGSRTSKYTLHGKIWKLKTKIRKLWEKYTR